MSIKNERQYKDVNKVLKSQVFHDHTISVFHSALPQQASLDISVVLGFLSTLEVVALCLHTWIQSTSHIQAHHSSKSSQFQGQLYHSLL